MTQKVRPGIIVLLTGWVVLVGGLAVGADRGGQQPTIDRLEAAVAAAKAEHRLHPGPDTLAAVEAAVSALQGAAAARPGSPLAQATEVEPTNTAATATALAASDYGTGGITPAADVDFWSGAGAAIGNLVFAHVDTGESSGGTDSTLNVLANDGATVIEFDDDDGGPLESVVAGAPVPQAGNVFFEVHEYGDNGTITPYHLTVVVVDPAAAVAETEPNDTAATATPVTAAMMTAQLAAAAPDTDFFAFSAAAGDRLCVIVDNDPDNDATITDTEIAILGTDGTTVLLTGDNGGGNGNAAGTVVAAASGTYYLRVQNGTTSADTDYTFAVVVNGHAVPVELQKLTVE
jgi:hypothetical protein